MKLTPLSPELSFTPEWKNYSLCNVSGAVITIEPEPDVLISETHRTSILYFSILWTRRACKASCLTDLTFPQLMVILDFACFIAMIFPRTWLVDFSTSSPYSKSRHFPGTPQHGGFAYFLKLPSTITGKAVAVFTIFLGLRSIDLSLE